MVDVALVDDHALLLDGLRLGLERRLVTAEAVADLSSVDAIVAELDRLDPRLVVLDYVIPTIGTSRPLLERAEAPVLFLTGSGDDALWGSLVHAGALGVVSKEEPIDAILDVVVDLLDGRPFRPSARDRMLAAFVRQDADRRAAHAPFESLTGREREVVRGLMAGRSPSEIAETDFVSVGTVRSHLKSIYRKLDVSSQLEVVTKAHDVGWSPPSS